jgi:NAD(P)-dependent dehydrogenase (short-subunit alcohol dehydrogenase family)
MRARLKPLDRQIIVITGASSGIGLVTSKCAAARGARLVLAARNEPALKQVCEGILASGGDATYVMADVSKEGDVRQVAQAAMARYGGFDTWVNAAAVAIYGTLREVSAEDARRLFEINFWGTYYGSRIAAEHFTQAGREHGGAIINLGSILSDHAIPLQSMYSASKHAVKALTDALRMELRAERAPVSLTLIKPGSIDTPYVRHARNYMDVAPAYLPPVYAPEVVARAILRAAEHPLHSIVVGGGGRLMSTLGIVLPALADRLYARIMPPLQRSTLPSTGHDDSNLYAPTQDGDERSRYPRMHVFRRSLYTSARLHPATTAVVMLLAGVTALALWRQ